MTESCGTQGVLTQADGRLAVCTARFSTRHVATEYVPPLNFGVRVSESSFHLGWMWKAAAISLPFVFGTYISRDYLDLNHGLGVGLAS